MKQADIILLSGQSNAVGVGHVKCLPKHFCAEKVQEYLTGYSNVRINYYSHDKKSGGFVTTAAGCTEKSKDTLGPEVGIAEYFTGRFPEKELFIVKCAFGGMSLCRDFLSPSGGDAYDPTAYADQYEDILEAAFGGKPVRAGWCYNELVRLTHESIAALEAQGYAPKIRGFCWMQGENDACDPDATAQYIGRYDAMLQDLCAEFGAYIDECIFVDAGISEQWPHYRELNAAKAQYAAAAPNRRYVDTIAAGLITAGEPEEEPDTYHYNSDCIVRLGQLFAEQILPE